MRGRRRRRLHRSALASNDLLEKDFQAQVTELAEILGWSWVHFRPLRTKHGWQTAVSGPLGEGWPDLFLARDRDGRVMVLELKKAGAKASPAQTDVMGYLERAGMEGHFAWPDDFELVAGWLR